MSSVRPRSTSRRPTSRRRRTKGGFSLLEALAAATILSHALLALALGTIMLTRNEKHVDRVNAGFGLAQQTVEDLRSLPLGSASLNPGNYSTAGTLKADGTANGPFTRRWTVSANNVPADGLRTVTVSVTWYDSAKDASGGVHTTQASGYIRCVNIPCP
jgi:Tfp pilus assembly protein PilV